MSMEHTRTCPCQGCQAMRSRNLANVRDEYARTHLYQGEYFYGSLRPETPRDCNEAEAGIPEAEIEADNAAMLRSFGVRV